MFAFLLLFGVGQSSSAVPAFAETVVAAEDVGEGKTHTAACHAPVLAAGRMTCGIDSTVSDLQTRTSCLCP